MNDPRKLFSKTPEISGEILIDSRPPVDVKPVIESERERADQERAVNRQMENVSLPDLQPSLYFLADLGATLLNEEKVQRAWQQFRVEKLVEEKKTEGVDTKANSIKRGPHKLAVIGTKSSGKTTYVQQLKNKHVGTTPTVGIEFTSVTLSTNGGDVKFYVYDAPPMPITNRTMQEFMKSCHFVIVMLDSTNFEESKEYAEKFVDDFPLTPAIAIVTKINQQNPLFQFSSKIDHIPFFYKRSKSLYNPLLWAARYLKGEPTLVLTETAGTVTDQKA